MKNFLFSLVLPLVVAAFALGQAPAAAPALPPSALPAAIAPRALPALSPSVAAPPAAASTFALPPGVTVSDPEYPYPPELHAKTRDRQLEYDELEIDIQKNLLKIEQDKERQTALMDGIKLDAYQFAQTKSIDLLTYEIDAKELKFVKKKKAAIK
jgi:hypothetical protein